MLISFEGIDGAGKSTQARLLASSLGPDTVLVREPGGTEAGERIRTLLKEPALELGADAELLLFLAARAELCAKVIRPALAEGRTVVCDRFSDSSVAYQGVGRALGAERVRRLCEIATAGLWPDLTILLEIDPEGAQARREGRVVDRFEGEGASLQGLAAEGYRRLAAEDPDRVRVVRGDGSPGEVAARVRGLVAELAAPALGGAG